MLEIPGLIGNRSGVMEVIEDMSDHFHSRLTRVGNTGATKAQEHQRGARSHGTRQCRLRHV
jgi:hypothetical protein